MNPSVVIGVDEAGNGALAGPLIVAATAFAQGAEPVRAVYKTLRGDKVLTVHDSKTFARAEHRDVLAQAVRMHALAFAVIERSAQEIDDRLIHVILAESIRLAASRVIERLAADFPDPTQFLVLLDGKHYAPTDIPCAVRAVPGGDALLWQIGAASLLAKSARDARMLQYAEKYPRYRFDKHKGYPVAEHKDLLKLYGACPIHRQSYRPVRALRPPALGFEE